MTESRHIHTTATGDIIHTHRPEAILVLTLLAVVCGFWIVYPHSYVSDDLYFYLEIARNLATGEGQSFTEIYPTNGFHPLWLYILAIWSYLLQLMDATLLGSLRYPLPLTISCLLGSSLLLWRLARHQELNPAILLLPLIAYQGFFGHLYSAVHLSILLIAVILTIMERPWWNDVRGTVWLGVFTGLLFLSRLDMLYTVFGIFITLWVRRGLYAPPIFAGLVSLATVLPYLLFNIFVYDGLTPVSGWLKTSFPDIQLLLHYRPLTYYGGFHLEWVGYNVIIGVFPIILAILTVIFLRRQEGFIHKFPYFLLMGTLLHFIYTSCFTRFATEWYWYYGAHQLLLAFSLAWLAKSWRIPRNLIIVTGVALVIMVSGLLVFKRATPEDPTARPLPTIKYLKENGINNSTIILSDFPGRVAFDTDNHIIALDMLTGNRKLVTQMTQSNNALEYLQKLTEEKGRPATLLIWMGHNDYLTTNDDHTKVVYNHPKHVPNHVPIGTLTVNKPLYDSKNLIIWKLPPD